MSPLLLALVMLAQSTVYVWVDKDGVEHFTDDLASVPRGVKVRTTEGTAISRIEPDLAKYVKPAVASAASEPALPSASEQGWRQLFKDAKNKLRVLEEDIEADRKKVEEVNGLPLTAQFTCATGFYPQPIAVGGATTTATVVVAGQAAPGVAVSTVVTGTVVHRPPPLYAAPCFYGFNPEFERLRERLEKNRRDLVRAKEELADLERRASFEAVPLHWRR